MSVLTTVDEVVEAIRGAAVGNRTTVVGIAGSPGAGKSHIGKQVVNRLAPDAALLPLDGFHLPQSRLVALGRRNRMGAPDTYDIVEFLSALTALNSTIHPGRDWSAPIFDREIEEPVPDAFAIPFGTPFVVIEGNYLLLDNGGWEHAASRIDVTFFVDSDSSIRQQRLIDRHIQYGKTPEAAREWALGTDERNAAVIEPTAARADHIIRF